MGLVAMHARIVAFCASVEGDWFLVLVGGNRLPHPPLPVPNRSAGRVAGWPMFWLGPVVIFVLLNWFWIPAVGDAGMTMGSE